MASYSADPAVASSLGTKLDAAAAAAAADGRGNANAKANQIQAFGHQVDAQTGRALTAAQVATLIRHAESL